MSELSRLQLLTAQMHLEPAEDTHCPQISTRKQDEVYVSKAQLPNGKSISLLKTLLSSVCERNCFYCPFRSERDFRRASFSPDEFAKLFMYMHKTGKVEGIFLSSGVFDGGLRTQDKLLDTATLMRRKYQYQGYLHLKIMPGADKEQVRQAMLLADRISINLEAPNTKRLQLLAPKKQFLDELLQPIRWADQIRRENHPYQAWKGTWPSTVTQFVVGGADESDNELLVTTEKLHRQMGLARAYFSGFSPVPDTPFENRAPTPLIRQNRLYQASFLLRDYGFNMEELPFQSEGNLPLEVDPKLAWAELNLQNQPIEINHAPRELLLRIPGVGPLGVKKIIKARRDQKLRSLATLKKLGIQAKKAAPYILLDGQQPAHQLALF
jgi:predicted DNA-binding helix-hairpin-helix protein